MSTTSGGMTTTLTHDVVAGIDGHLGDSDRVLVLGPAAHAFAAAEVVGGAGRVIGVGLAGTALADAEDTRRRAGWLGLEFRQETAGTLPADDRSVDAVVIAPPVALSRSRGALLCEIARVLRPGGRLVVAAG